MPSSTPARQPRTRPLPHSSTPGSLHNKRCSVGVLKANCDHGRPCSSDRSRWLRITAATGQIARNDPDGQCIGLVATLYL